ncbi:MAG: response regulator transcription factor [Chloroflexi bacterium]|nr:response regulator transcription factor [Chloroflexota bacterium]
MASITDVNLKVLVMDTDYYALHAINGFLAWDRRTRVTNLSETVRQMWAYIEHTPLAEHPDVVLLEADHIGGPGELRRVISDLHRTVEDVRVICLAQFADPALVEAAAEAGAAGFLLKQEVRLQIAWAIVYALKRDFVVTAGVARVCQHLANRRVLHADTLPEMRKFPELTDRIRQAIKLCVVEGMPAHLAADEMGISLHTIRGYIKEGYRILEAYDETEYPVDMTPQERAFMRFTAFEEDRGGRPFFASSS